MNYYTYWDIESAASAPMSDEGVIGFAAILVLIVGFAVLLFNKRLPLEFRRSVPYGVLGLGVLLLASYLYIDYAKKSLPASSPLSKREESKMVEGIILNYKEKILKAPRGGTQTVASFDIKNVSFHFSGVNVGNNKSFSLTRSKGGILNNGMQARITYDSKNNSILKIELIQE